MNDLVLPEGWAWKKLGEVCEDIMYGLTTNAQDSGNAVLLRITDINDRGDLNPNLKYTEVDTLAFKKYKLDRGDIVIARSGATAGKAYIHKAGENFVFASYLIKFSINPQNTFPEFVFKFMLSEFYWRQLNVIKVGGAQPNVNATNLQGIKIPLPPLPTQRRIVAKIDAAFSRLDEAIHLQKQNIQRTEKMKKSVLEEVFGKIAGKYEMKKLSFFDKIQSGGTPSRQVKEYWGGEINWFSSGELNYHTVSSSKEKITESGLKNSNARLFDAGTLLIGMYDTAALKMSILENPATCNQAIVGIKPNKNVLNIFFLKYQLEFLRPIILLQRQGVRQQNLNTQKIKDISIVFPPPTEQQSLVRHLDRTFAQLDALHAEQTTRLQHFESLKSSILAEAFQGKL